jgi:hypothetical protein
MTELPAHVWIKSPALKLPVEKVFFGSVEELIYHHCCLYLQEPTKNITKYSKHWELPLSNFFVVAVERKPFLPDHNIPQFVDRLSSSAGRDQTPQDFSAGFVEINQSLRVESVCPHLMLHLKKNKTMHWYRISIFVHPAANVTLVLPTFIKGQDVKRGVTQHTFGNVLAQANKL